MIAKHLSAGIVGWMPVVDLMAGGKQLVTSTGKQAACEWNSGQPPAGLCGGPKWAGKQNLHEQINGL